MSYKTHSFAIASLVFATAVSGCAMIRGPKKANKAPSAAPTTTSAAQQTPAKDQPPAPKLTLRNATDKTLCKVFVVKGGWAKGVRGSWSSNRLPAGKKLAAGESIELELPHTSVNNQVDIRANDCEGKLVMRSYYAHKLVAAATSFDITAGDQGSGIKRGLNITLVNRCSKAVSYCVVGGGSSTKATLRAKGNETVKAPVGSKVHRRIAANDCNDLVYQVTASSKDARIVLCK